MKTKNNDSITANSTTNTSEYDDIRNPKHKFIIQQPLYVGRYQIGGKNGLSISVSIEDKPNFINRCFCKWCLGWKWIDE